MGGRSVGRAAAWVACLALGAAMVAVDVAWSGAGKASSGGPAALPAALYHDTEGNVLGAADEGIFAQRGVAGQDAIEPMVAFSLAGDVVFTTRAHAAVPEAQTRQTLHRSADLGLTWEEVTPVRDVLPYTYYEGDPALATDPATGRIWYADLDIVTFFGGEQMAEPLCHGVSWSDDDGRTWASSHSLCEAVDHQTLFAGPPRVARTQGYPSVLYYCAIGPSCFRSLDGGPTWEEVGRPFEWSGCTGHVGHGRASPATGIAYIGTGACGQVMVAATEDDGLTWRRSVVDATHGAPAHDVQVAVDAADNAYAFWVDAAGRPRLAASRDEGRTWGPARDVGHPEVREALPILVAVVAGDEGKVAFAYVASPSPENDASAHWHGYVGIVEDALAPDPTVLSVRATPDPLHRGECPGTCSARNAGARALLPVQMAPHGMFDYLGIALDPTTGRVAASVVDLCLGACAEGAATWEPGGLGALLVQVDGPVLATPRAPAPAGALRAAPPAPAAVPLLDGALR